MHSSLRWLASSLVVTCGLAGSAAAGGGARVEPLRVTIECERVGRTKACPAFLLGLVEDTPLLLASPRATAEVVLYVSAAEIANADRLHLRFVGEVRGAPGTIEIDVDLDTRGTDDEQLAQLQPAFVRGIALFVAARHPEAVTVELTTPTGEVAATHTTPWGVDLTLAAFGSATGPYQVASGSGILKLARVTTTRRYNFIVGGIGAITRSPSVGGVSFDTTQWSMSSGLYYTRLLDPCYAIQLRTSNWRDDPKGQYRYGWDGAVALEWDRYPSDDPRGNVLAVAYALGYQVEGYNFRNVLGERFAQYPTQHLGATASLRRDKVSYNLRLNVTSELLHPTRRYTLSATPAIELKLGDHVDLAFEVSLTRRELPAFDLPEDDPEAISRASYAEPTSMSGSANLRIHWDPTNGERNNRFDNL